MPKHIIEFNLPEEREELESAMNGWKAELRIEDIWNQCFRPYNKHGFNDERMNRILETEDGQYLMDELIKIFISTGEE